MGKNNFYQGAFSRRRFSNYNVVGKQTTNASTGNYTLNAVSGNPSLGSVQVSRVESLQIDSDIHIEQQYNDRRVFPSYSVKALPYEGSRFVGWKGDFPSGKQQANPIVVTLNKNIALTAVFERIDTASNIIVNWDASMGRVTASGMQNGRVTAAPGTQVTLEATPKDGYVFKRWDGIKIAGNVQDNTSRRITLTMPSRDLTLTAVFAKSTENPGGGGGTPQGGSSDDNSGDGVTVMPTVVSTSGSLADKVVPFVKKWWWAIAIVAWVWYENRKGGSK